MTDCYYFSKWEYFVAKLRGLKKSSTIWFNATVAAIVSGLPMAIESFPQIKGYVPDNIYSTAWVALVVGNILFRIKTTQDLADK